MKVKWQLLECAPAWEGNWTFDCFVAFAWQSPAGERLLVIVNYAPNQSQCHVRMPFADLGGQKWRIEDLLDSAGYDWDGDDLLSRGLFVDMAAWQACVFTLGEGRAATRAAVSAGQSDDMRPVKISDVQPADRLSHATRRSFSLVRILQARILSALDGIPRFSASRRLLSIFDRLSVL